MSHPSLLVMLIQIAEQHRLGSDEFTRSLSAAKVRTLKAGDVARKFADGGGLTLYVPPGGAKTWRYRFRLEGKEQTLTLGSYPEVSLEQARVAHRAARWLVARGVHPLQQIRAEAEQRDALAAADTANRFRQVYEEWSESTKATLSPRTVKHRQAMLERHVLPTLGERPIASITKKELRDLLVPLDQSAPVTARHCRGYLRQIFEFAEDAELVDANPTPRTGVLLNATRRSVVPRKAMPVRGLGRFLVTLQSAPDTDANTKVALQLLLLTWCRTAEVVGARWSEFDFEAGEWVIPAERMKAREPHRVFLSRQAVSLLRTHRALVSGAFLFPNRRKPDEPMHRMTLTAWRKRWGFSEVMDVHGLRATASTWANETGRFRPDVIEVALAHKEGDRVRAAYNRAQFLDELRALWQSWADMLDERVALERSKVNGQLACAVTG